MSNSSKARNHFSEIGVRNRLRRITRKLFPPPPPLLPPPSPPAPSRFFFETAFYHPEKNIPKRKVGREEPSAALLLRSLDSPQLRSAVNQPFHRPAPPPLPKGLAMNLKVNNFFERSERLIHRANKRRKSAVNTKERGDKEETDWRHNATTRGGDNGGDFGEIRGTKKKRAREREESFRIDSLSVRVPRSISLLSKRLPLRLHYSSPRSCYQGLWPTGLCTLAVCFATPPRFVRVHVSVWVCVRVWDARLCGWGGRWRGRGGACLRVHYADCWSRPLRRT